MTSLHDDRNAASTPIAAIDLSGGLQVGRAGLHEGLVLEAAG